MGLALKGLVRLGPRPGHRATQDSRKHKWTFTSRLLAPTFGWRSSMLACKRLPEAVSEIKKVARKDPVLGAEEATP